MIKQPLSLTSSLLLLISFLSCSVDSSQTPPTTLTTFYQSNVTQVDLITGETLYNFPIQQNLRVFSLFQCSGDDYIILTFELSDFGSYNISILDIESKTLTTKAQFTVPHNFYVSYQFNSIDLSSGQAFTATCDEDLIPRISIFNLNNQSAYDIRLTEMSCLNRALGQYDSSTQTYYIYSDESRTQLTFGEYSLVTNSLTQRQYPYKMEGYGYVQQVFIYQSTLYLCVLQPYFFEIIAIDIGTNKMQSIFKKDQIYTDAQFMFDQNGYILALLNQNDTPYLYTINLDTLQSTSKSMEIQDLTIFNNFNQNTFCAQ